jgi:hypothetical protein
VVGKSATVCRKLIAYASQNWVAIDASNPGLDILSLRPDRFLNVVHQWLRARVKDVEMFEMMLNTPPPAPRGKPAPPTPMEAESEMADFGALYAEMQQGL